MKCINCNYDIPENSSVCPYCNSPQTQVPVTEDTSIIPQTPSDYILPKDQQMMTQKLEVVSDANIPAPPTPPVENNIPAPPTPPAPPQMSTADDGSIGTITPPTQGATITPNIDLSNVDLNANANAQSIDLTQSGVKEGMTLAGTDKKKTKKKVKLVPIIAIAVIVLALIGGGVFVYTTQYKSANDRINGVVDTMFSFTNNITNYKVNDGSGTYKFTYNSSKNEEQLIIEANGKYLYNLPGKQVDLITYFTRYNNNQELLSQDLNTELFLKNDKAYLLLQNFNDNYIYTDVNNSYTVIKDVESRFNDPENLLLFKVTDTLFDNGLDDFSKNYDTYITNISKNENVDYKVLVNGLKASLKGALNSAPVTQKLEGTTNVVRIDVKSANTQKKMYTTFVNNFANQTKAMEQLSTIVGKNKDEIKKDLLDKIDTIEFKDLKSDIIIETDMFKRNLKSLTIPYNSGDESRLIVITPNGSGYKILIKNNTSELANLKYNKKKSKTSTTETVDYTVEGVLYKDSSVTNLNIELEVVKDVTPSKDYPITKDSLDYSVLTPDNYAQTAAKIEAFGNLGVLFKSHYKGSTPVDPNQEGQVNE